MNVVVSGSSGFIGSHLVVELAERGHKVLALSRSMGGALPSDHIQYLNWSLDQAHLELAPRAVDCAVHLAHDFNGEDGARISVRGTLNLIESCRRAGAKRQIFLSSLSAHEAATSRYGCAKYEIEQQVKSMQDIVIIRPGLVLGNGGLYGRIKTWIKKFPLVPLPDGGCGSIYVIELPQLIQKTLSIMQAKETDPFYNLFEHDPKTLREIILREASASRRNIFIINVPTKFLLRILSIFEFFKIPLPVTSDNLRGFLSNQISSTLFHHPSPW